jgi:hypothetical protein
MSVEQVRHHPLHVLYPPLGEVAHLLEAGAGRQEAVQGGLRQAQGARG